MPTIKIKGLAKLTKHLRKVELEQWKVAMRVIDKYVTLMVAEARRLAPVDTGFTADSIDKEKTGQFSITFVVKSAYAAMQEFGLGVYMDIPEELEREAIKFKGYKHGSFEEFVQELEEWCARKGIDTNAAYPIAIKILNVGMQPQPFFYPAYRKYKDEMVKAIDEALQKLIGK